KPVRHKEVYSLRQGRRPALTLKLEAQPGDHRVAERLALNDVPVGILSPENVMRAVLDGFPVRVVAPLQSGGDVLVAWPDSAGDSWRSFVDWVRVSDRPVRVGYVPREPNALFAFEQALEYENASGRVTLFRLIDYDVLVRALDEGTLDAAVLANPAAGEVAAASGSRLLCSLNDLPPDRFENSPSTVIAATDSVLAADSRSVGLFLELMACATHYANNRTAATRAAAARWLETTPAEESAAFSTYRFSSLPDWHFRTGLWNWFFALRLKNQVPARYAGLMAPDEWYGIPYDSSPAIPALGRAGARIIR
ncbi:hypothetical protein FJY71_10265, partial [candidate division WOR-3 bacterium]|nr:hypothetical protein [candidate division WOR-3 bacterium]